MRRYSMFLMVERELPEFSRAVKKAYENKETFVLLHQDAFGADYQEEEFFLLGNAIKYAGEFGIEIRIIGHNRETLYKK